MKPKEGSQGNLGMDERITNERREREKEGQKIE